MSDVGGGPGAGARMGGTGSRPGGYLPPVLLAALAAALLIGGTLGFLAMARGGDGGEPVRPASASAAPSDDRVALSVTFAGDGSGAIEIEPGPIKCTESCEWRFKPGTQVTVTADAAKGSTFQSWDDACSGEEDCTFTMGQDRTLTVSFKADELKLPDVPPTPSGPSDCDDRTDNDQDGLTDTAQDPDCLAGDTESGSGARSDATAAADPVDDCTDGRDNDSDGLTDVDQDPDCLTGTAESGATTDAGTPAATPSSNCQDGRDNDGDGLTDSEQDPDCTTGRNERG